ncbi:uncharacterized protein SOCE26_063690 [Sorangium cellulosum]|uniref:Uncharacterized protein n=1 Tax=Sorangium cellulosum TaxID=56 RepID=A0A2L0F0A0_SORCE|nr:hypothetical protein [Sorangium cellulosum]AUX44899.1 uncharacterized protein SOCE26_063690 [Sorangium cellulosum]
MTAPEPSQRGSLFHGITFSPVERVASGVLRLVSGSALGLARVRAEGGLDVDCTIEGDELAIIAHAPVGRWR